MPIRDDNERAGCSGRRALPLLSPSTKPKRDRGVVGFDFVEHRLIGAALGVIVADFDARQGSQIALVGQQGPLSTIRDFGEQCRGAVAAVAARYRNVREPQVSATVEQPKARGGFRSLCSIRESRRTH